ncbi:ubiquinone/menaquinone biosynthesis C-methylase UbiE [Bacillus mesophilus]|nr:methyltransferase domain-containing protein [Bacillus mesophilus]MBM7663244.1 ubiquinone/menaquinone biosynthesis C-methylase UbiE [Bacillus mesophilus]
MFDWHYEAQKKWDEKADFWNQSSKDMWDQGSRSTIIPFLQQHIKPCSILDAGCGDGYGSYMLQKQGFKVTGVDVSTNMIEIAKGRDTKNELQFLQSDIAKMPFPDASFEAIMAINSLEWTIDPLEVVKEFKRVLRPSGTLCIGLLGPTAAPRQNSYQRLYGENVICNTMMPWELQSLAEENGFRLIDGHGVYKKGVTPQTLNGLSSELKQALSFMWVFMFEKKE